MLLTQSKKFNSNYAAKIVEVKSFTQHPNPKCERLKMAHVDGFNIAVSIDTEPGTYVYFPLECQIAAAYLYANNLYRHKELNLNTEIAGFFEDNRRVKAIKLQKFPSEGLIMPIHSLYEFAAAAHISDATIISNLSIGTEFDSIDNELLCKKYVVRQHSTSSHGPKAAKQVKGIDRMIEGQFRFHYDTQLLKKTPWIVKPNSLISITTKVHGTSGISAYIRVLDKPTWKTKVIHWVASLVKYPHRFTHFDYIYSSRKVIKNKYYNPNAGSYYSSDVWGEADKCLRPYLVKGMTLYYEILGYCPDGAPIQQAGEVFDYGCEQPKAGEEYTLNKHFKIMVYRITLTNDDGIVHEFSAREVQQWCRTNGVMSVKQNYYGLAKDLYPDLEDDDDFGELFVANLATDSRFHMEELSPDCKNSVPHEGVVLKIEDMQSAAYKLKCFRFLEKETKELDKGHVNIEDNQDEDELTLKNIEGD